MLVDPEKTIIFYLSRINNIEEDNPDATYESRLNEFQILIDISRRFRQMYRDAGGSALELYTVIHRDMPGIMITTQESNIDPVEIFKDCIWDLKHEVRARVGITIFPDMGKGPKPAPWNAEEN